MPFDHDEPPNRSSCRHVRVAAVAAGPTRLRTDLFAARPGGLVAGRRQAIDVTGAHPGTMVGGATFAPGVVGSAFSFNGTNSVQVPDSPALNPTNEITVEAWINPMVGQSQGNYLEGNPPIIKKATYALEMAGDGTMCFFVFVRGAGGAGWVGVCALIVPGQWMHVAGVYDGQSVMLYVNGLLVASGSGAGTIEPSNGSLGIGLDPTLDRHYKGLIDEPAVFNRALAPPEIAAIYASGATGHCGSPLTTGMLIRSHFLLTHSVGTLSAWLFKDSEALTGKPLEFLVQGASAGIGTTDAGGLATIVFQVSLNPGLYSNALEVRFAGDGDLGPRRRAPICSCTVCPGLCRATAPLRSRSRALLVAGSTTRRSIRSAILSTFRTRSTARSASPTGRRARRYGQFR